MVLKFNFDNTYSRLPADFFVHTAPASFKSPRLFVFNEKLAIELGLCESKPYDGELAMFFSGQNILPQAHAIALPYAGHQFGHFNILGDGRAHLLGEHIDNLDRRFDIQLKGSGKTPFSRQGDGKATLGPMLREYIISEAMHALGIPTTRSLAVVTTGENVMREKIYPGAILTRIAASHIRIGSFEYFAAKKDASGLKLLTQYTIERHYPELLNLENPYLSLLNALMERQIEVLVHWLRVGFIHGVMNTDNICLSGETIDYGPCAFMDSYHPHTVFSSIDTHGRYAFVNQVPIMQWNLTRFAETQLSFYHADLNTAVTMAEDILNQFPKIFKQKWLSMMRAKLGLFKQYEEDDFLIYELLKIMENEKRDYTNTFLELTQGKKTVSSDWYDMWLQRRQSEVKSQELMQQTNPVVIPRNHQVEQVLQAAIEGDREPLFKLVDILSSPYTPSDDKTNYQLPPMPSDQIYRTFCGT